LSKLEELLERWMRNAKRLFHFAIGLVFLVLTFAGASVSFAEWRYYEHSPSVGLVRFGLLAGFTGLLFIFCLYSFLKARSVR
jgi:cytochrome b subunit of formate dehydrogenase